MSTNAFFAMGLLVGIMLAAWGLGRKWAKQKHYDEMQLKIRAEGYRLGFFTALAMIVVLILLYELGLMARIAPSLAAFAVLMVSVVVFAVYCIRHEAYIQIGGKRKEKIAIFALVTVCNGLVVVLRLARGEALENGALTLSFGAPALVTLGFLAVLVAMLIGPRRPESEAEE